MQKQIPSLGIKMQHFTAPCLDHKFPLVLQKNSFVVYAPHIEYGRHTYPEKIKFITHTLKYSKCNWVEILGLEKPYQRSRIEITSRTQN